VRENLLNASSWQPWQVSAPTYSSPGGVAAVVAD
jgi:hypothetical protein